MAGPIIWQKAVIRGMSSSAATRVIASSRDASGPSTSPASAWRARAANGEPGSSATPTMAAASSPASGRSATSRS